MAKWVYRGGPADGWQSDVEMPPLSYVSLTEERNVQKMPDGTVKGDLAFVRTAIYEADAETRTRVFRGWEGE